MKQWQIFDGEQIKLTEDSVIQRKQGEVKLKLFKVAVSAADVIPFVNRSDDSAPTVAGHSAIAYVSEADEESGLLLGSRVCVCPFVNSLERGEVVSRTMGVDENGLLCDFVCVPEEYVFALPDGIADEEAVFTDCIAMANKVYEVLDSNAGDYVVIVGANTLGMVLCQLASYYRLVPILVDLDNEKLELARKWDVSYTLNPTYDNLERRVEEITGGRMSESAVFAGEGIGLNAALRLVKNNGEVIIAGYSSNEKHQVDTDEILRKQLTLKGVCNGAGEFSSAINLLANKIVRIEGFVSAHKTFKDVPKLVKEFVKYPYKYNNVIVEMD